MSKVIYITRVGTIRSKTSVELAGYEDEESGISIGVGNNRSA
jgi:hypothetical protein